ncbi:MAG: redoxin family protein [Candidatus Hydrogenedentes bacterium]|nr:redoxin family protein [Candidatus Hydrogenedentota bacterium]
MKKSISSVLLTLFFILFTNFTTNLSGESTPLEDFISRFDSLKKADAFDVKGTIVYSINSENGPVNIEQEFQIVSKGQDLSFLALHTKNGKIMVYRKGPKLTIYSEKEKKYIERESPASVKAFGLLGTPDLIDDIVFNNELDNSKFKVKRMEEQSENAENLFEVEFTEGEKANFWFKNDKTRLLSKVMVSIPTSEISSGGKKTFHFKDWKLNPPVENAIFEFNPPPGVEKVESKQRKDPLIGKTAPDFTLPNFDGGKVTLSEFKGKKVVVLDFWASWCGPCRMAMPVVQQVSNELKDKDVVFFAINIGEDKLKIHNFITKNNIKIPVLMDQTGRVAESYGVEGIPRLVIIDKNGIIRVGHSGFSQDMKNSLKNEILNILNNPNVETKKEDQ